MRILVLAVSALVASACSNAGFNDAGIDAGSGGGVTTGGGRATGGGTATGGGATGGGVATGGGSATGGGGDIATGGGAATGGGVSTTGGGSYSTGGGSSSTGGGSSSTGGGAATIDAGVDAGVICSTPVRIAPGTSVQHPEPDVAIDGQGNANVIWRQTASTGIVSIYSAHSSAGTWSAPTVLAADAGHYGTGMTIAANEKGDALATWVEENGGSSNHVWAASYTVLGGWTAPVDVQTSGWNVGESRVAIDAAGNGAVVFGQYPDQSGFTATWLARFHATGSTWDAPVRIDGYSNTVSLTSAPRVAMSADGTIVAIWLDQVPVAANVIGMAFLPDGGQIARTALDSNADNNTRPELAISANGEALAVWQQYRTGSVGQWDVAFARFSPDAGFSSAGLVDFVDGGSIIRPVVAMDSVGNGWAAWQQQTPTFTFRARAASFSRATGWVSTDIDAPTGTTNSSDLAVRLDATGSGMIVWNDSAIHGVKVIGSIAGPLRSISAGVSAMPTAGQPKVVSWGGKYLVIYSAYDTTNAVWASWCQ